MEIGALDTLGKSHVTKVSTRFKGQMHRSYNPSPISILDTLYHNATGKSSGFGRFRNSGFSGIINALRYFFQKSRLE